jgi:hypothetical protein
MASRCPIFLPRRHSGHMQAELAGHGPTLSLTHEQPVRVHLERQGNRLGVAAVQFHGQKTDQVRVRSGPPFQPSDLPHLIDRRADSSVRAAPRGGKSREALGPRTRSRIRFRPIPASCSNSNVSRPQNHTGGR